MCVSKREREIARGALFSKQYVLSTEVVNDPVSLEKSESVSKERNICAKLSIKTAFRNKAKNRKK